MFITDDLLILKASLRKAIDEVYPPAVRRRFIEGTRGGVIDAIITKVSELGLEEVFLDIDFDEKASLLNVIAFEEGRALLPYSISENLLCKMIDAPEATCCFKSRDNSLFSTTTHGVLCESGKIYTTQSSGQKKSCIDISRVYELHTQGSEFSHKNSLFFTSAFYAIKASEISGMCDAIFTDALSYLKTRKQYGRLLGEFQALQHKAAECHLLAEACAALSEFSAFTIDKKSDEYFSALSSYHFALKSAPQLIESCLQILGGIGFTWEYDLHFYLRRAKFLEVIALENLSNELFDVAIRREARSTI